MDLGNQRSVEERPFSKRAPDRTALKDRHASSARTVRTGVPPLRVETAPHVADAGVVTRFPLLAPEARWCALRKPGGVRAHLTRA